MAAPMRKLMMALRIPPSGTTKEASGVAHTMAEAATVTSKVAPKAIYQTLRPRRWRPRDFQPSLVTTSSMIKAATVGVHDHKVHIAKPGGSSRNLMNREDSSLGRIG